MRRRLIGRAAPLGHPTPRHGRRAFAALLAGVLLAGTPLAQAGAAARPGKPPAVAWDLLAQARPAAKALGAPIAFPPALDQLDGRQVTITGSMVPLEARFEQTRFLLTQQPQDCESCIEGGPSRYVEVRSQPLHYSGQPYTMTGRLQLLRQDASGLYYRLLDSRLAAS